MPNGKEPRRTTRWPLRRALAPQLDELREERYSGVEGAGGGGDAETGANLKAIAKRVVAETIDPTPRSGRQKFFENLVNRYI